MDVLIKQISEAKSKRSWIDIAIAFRQGATIEGTERATFEHNAVQASGYSLDLLKRFVAALTYVESTPEQETPPKHVLEASFTAIELIVRLSRFDQTSASKWIRKLDGRSAFVGAISQELGKAQGAVKAMQTPLEKTVSPSIPVRPPDVQETERDAALNSLINQLTKARSEGQPWHALGRVLQAAAKNGQDATILHSIIAAASRSTGLDAMMFHKFRDAVDRMDAIAASLNRDVEELLPSSYSATVVALRIYKLDSEKGLAAFQGLRDRSKTLENVRDTLATLVAENPSDNNTKSHAARERAATLKRCHLALSESAAKLFGPGVTVDRRPALRLFHQHGFHVARPDGALCAGIDLYLPEPATSPRDPVDALVQSVWLSCHYDRFHVVFGPGVDAPTIARAREALEILYAPWIGIGVINGDGKLDVIREAEGNPPIDRTRSLPALVDRLRGRWPRGKSMVQDGEQDIPADEPETQMPKP